MRYGGLTTSVYGGIGLQGAKHIHIYRIGLHTTAIDFAGDSMKRALQLFAEKTFRQGGKYRDVHLNRQGIDQGRGANAMAKTVSGQKKSNMFKWERQI
jgi:hypothetical protein